LSTQGSSREALDSRTRFLLLRPDRVGDVVLMTPLIRAIRETCPDATIAALVRPYTEAVLRGNPHVHRVFTDDFDGRDSGWRGFRSLVSAIRRERFDVSLMLLPTRRHALMTLLAGIPRRISVGRKPYEVRTGARPAGRNRDRPPRHEADYCMDLGRLVGVDSANLTPEIFLDDEERETGRRLLREAGAGPGPIVGIHPGSGGSAPNWDVSGYTSLAASVARDLKACVVITGGDSETEMANKIEECAGTRVVNLAGRLDLRDLMKVIASYDVLVSSSTGPMHIAAAVGIPSVALFCPRTACSPTRWGPLGVGHRIFLPRSDRCDRCGPVRDPECTLAEIPLERVVAAVSEVVESGVG